MVTPSNEGQGRAMFCQRVILWDDLRMGKPHTKKWPP